MRRPSTASQWTASPSHPEPAGAASIALHGVSVVAAGHPILSGVSLSIPAILGLLMLAALSGGLVALWVGLWRRRVGSAAPSGADHEPGTSPALAELSRNLAVSDDLDQVLDLFALDVAEQWSSQ